MNSTLWFAGRAAWNLRCPHRRVSLCRDRDQEEEHPRDMHGKKHRVKDFDAHYSSDNLVVSDEYQEEEHPRDMHGKWTSGDQTESPAFKSWFGESKIVDEHGKPLVVYHGTRHEFSRFDIDKGQVEAHFSVSPEVANAFARSQGGEGGSVIPALIVRYTATLRVICVHGC